MGRSLAVALAACAFLLVAALPFGGGGRGGFTPTGHAPPGGGGGNQAPTVDAESGASPNAYSGDEDTAIQLNASASDDGLPDPPATLTTKWTHDCTGTVTFSPDAFTSSATVTVADPQTCTLTWTGCDDGEAACQ